MDHSGHLHPTSLLHFFISPWEQVTLHFCLQFSIYFNPDVILTEMPRGFHSPPRFLERSSSKWWWWLCLYQRLSLGPWLLYTFPISSPWLKLVISFSFSSTTSSVLGFSMVVCLTLKKCLLQIVLNFSDGLVNFYQCHHTCTVQDAFIKQK